MTFKIGQKPPRRGESEVLDWLLAHLSYDGEDCLIWPFTGNWNGYGHVWIDGGVRYAHREMCRRAHGEPPTPKYVAAHSCHNGQGGCVNPKHLTWKTPSENLLDRRVAGTLTRKRWAGPTSSLTDDQIAEIVSLRGQKNQREIAAMFGISHQHVSVIQNGRLKSQAETFITTSTDEGNAR